MKKLLGALIASLLLIGCGGGTKEVKKDAAYYKEAFRKMTSIKVLNTKERVLFTMKSMRDYFVKNFDINGTNEGINRDILEVFKSNIANNIDELDSVTIKDDAPIFMAGMQLTEQPEKHLDAKLKSAIKTVCTECKEADIEDWFSNNLTSLEKSIEANNHVDEENDAQPYYAETPPPILLALLEPPPPHTIMAGAGDPDKDFIEIQTERARVGKIIDQYLP